MELEEALEYFRDAYWLFELVEYRLLEALAHDKLGQREQALAAYTAYVDHRPHGLEAAMAQDRIQALGENRGRHLDKTYSVKGAFSMSE